MLRVNDQAGVHDAGRHGVRLHLMEHPQEIGRVAEVVSRTNRRVPVAKPREGRDERRHLGDELDARVSLHVGVVDLLGRVEHPHGRDARLKDVHRVAVLGQVFEDIDDAVLQPSVVSKLIVELPELLACGQVSVDQQIRRLLEGAVICQVFDAVSAIEQLAFGAVDSADGRLGARDALEAAYECRWVRHASVSPGMIADASLGRRYYR